MRMRTRLDVWTGLLVAIAVVLALAIAVMAAGRTSSEGVVWVTHCVPVVTFIWAGKVAVPVTHWFAYDADGNAYSVDADQAQRLAGGGTVVVTTRTLCGVRVHEVVSVSGDAL